MIDQLALDSAIKTYEYLETTKELTHQIRGQKLNDLIVRVLAAHHVHAEANERSKGEIDVIFRVNDTRFLLEAKWHEKKIPVDPITKLKLRINQRMSNSVGILLSMSGFTSDAKDPSNQAMGPPVLLMDREVFNAILCGAVEATAFFTACVDCAAFRGDYVLTLASIFRHLRSPISSVKPATNDLVSDSAQRRLRPQGSFSEVKILKANLPYGQNGVSIAADKSVWVTLSDGLYRYDQGHFELAHAIANPQNRCIHDCKWAKTYFVHNGAVMAVDRSNEMYVVSKRRPGNVRLFGTDPVNVISNGSSFPGEPEFPVSVGLDLNEKELEIATTYPAGYASDACFIDHKTLAVIGSAGVRFFESYQEQRCNDSVKGTSVSFHSGRLFFLQNGVHLKSIDVEGGAVVSVVRFQLPGSVGDVAMPNATEFYFHLNYPDDGVHKGALVFVKL